MAQAPTAVEIERFRTMKAMRAGFMSWPEVVKQLTEQGLLMCRKSDGTAHTARRTSQDGIEFCTTCEDTATQFWRRNTAKLAADKPDVDEIAWNWQNAHEDIERICRERAIRESLTITERTETQTVIAADGTTRHEPVVIRTERRETIVDRGLLHLRSIVHDKIARAAGIDVGDPDPANTVPRGKTRVVRAPGRTDRDGGVAVN